MKITKFGHCCMLVEENGVRVLTDPGFYSDGQNAVERIDIVLVTHEHQDHLHIDSLKKVLQNNPQASIFTNRGVGALLDKEHIAYQLLEDGDERELQGIFVRGEGKEHAFIYPTLGTIPNTGYWITRRLFYPGDAFTVPKMPVEILALPVAAPWLKLSEAVDYAKTVRPSICFPVHDGILKSFGSAHRVPEQILQPLGIRWNVLEVNKEYEF